MVIKCVVPVSGGKDSQASLKLATRYFRPDEIVGLFCDTQFEHPLTYGHIECLKAWYDVPIVTVTGGSVLEKSAKYNRFPGGGARHCTDELKIVPTKKFCRSLAQAQGHGFEVWYGMRLGESPARAKRYAGKADTELYAPHDVMPSKYPKYLAKMGVRFRLCVLHWSEGEIMDFLEGLHNPLYNMGFPRVGCFPCLASGDRWKRKAFTHDTFGRQQYIQVMQVEDAIGKSVWTSKAGREDAPPCAVCGI